MMLNSKEIQSLGLIASGFEMSSLRDAGYDLRIAALMSKRETGEVDRFDDDVDLKPQGIAAVISTEIIKLPTNICAYASVKTTLCREGVLAINTGVVDPGWEGPLSSIVLNFGKDIYRLRAGEPFIRLTFHFIDDLHQPLSAPHEREKYEAQIRQKFSKRLADNFMNLDAAAQKGSEQLNRDMKAMLFKYVPMAAVMLALLTFLVNFGTLKLANWTTPSEMVLTRAKDLTNEAEKREDRIEQQNKELTQQIQQLQQQLKDLKKH
jgi:deoxycytidine triphosphate deaminase